MQFVKTGLIEPEYSAFYGDVMDARHSSDYDFVLNVERERAQSAIDEAEQFLARIERFLKKHGYGDSADVAD